MRRVLFGSLAATIVVTVLATVLSSALLGWLAVVLFVASLAAYIGWRRSRRSFRL